MPLVTKAPIHSITLLSFLPLNTAGLRKLVVLNPQIKLQESDTKSPPVYRRV